MIRGRRLPTVGEVFKLPSGALDATKASSDDMSSEYTYIMRLPGASEDTGALNCALFTLDGGLRLDHASGEGALFSIGPVSLPDVCPLLIPIVAEMLESPPHFGPQRAYAAGLDCLQLDLFFRYPRLGHVLLNPLTALGPYPPWCASLESLVTHVLGLPHLCYRSPQPRVLRLIHAWNLSLPDTPLSAVFFPRYAESAVDRYLRRARLSDVPMGPPCDLHRGVRPIDLPSLFPHYKDLTTLPEVPPPLLLCSFPFSPLFRLLPQGLRSLCVRGGGGRLWNTLAAGPSTHPYLLGLHPPQPAPTQLIAVMLGHCLGDPLICYLCDSIDGVPRCDPILAHDLLCRGLAVQPVAAILSAVRMLPKMRRVACLLVAHDFCGAHTLGSVLRSMCWPHALVYASESDLAARSAVLHVHPELASCHFALSAGDIAAIRAAPWAHLYFCGFSCNSLSNLNEYDTTAELRDLLLLLGRALEYVRHHRPLVVIFENVASIFHSHHRDFLSDFYALLAPLEALGYRFAEDCLCPSSFSCGFATRPRAFFLGC